MEIEESSAFRVTRDADLEIDDQSDDLLQAMETELRRRRFGDVVRLEIEARTSPEMREQLIHHLGVTARHVYSIDGLLDCADLTELVSAGPPELLFPEWPGITPPELQPPGEGLDPDIFAILRKGDVLVHHPYERFDTSVEAFVRQAVDDPDVLAIKHTIYRTSGDSPMVPMLIRAAEQGKQAVVLVELKARFDEERNIGWARALERAGRARRVRLRRAQDAREVRARRAARGRRHPALRPHRHGQLPPAHRAPVHRLRPAHVPARPRRRRRRPLQLPHGVRAPASLPQAARRAARPARADPRRGLARRREPHGRAPGPHRHEDELARRPRDDRGPVRGLAGGRPHRPDRARHLLPAARRARSLRGHPRRLAARALPRARARLPVHGRRRHADVHGLCRPDAAQPRRARRGRARPSRTRTRRTRSTSC